MDATQVAKDIAVVRPGGGGTILSGQTLVDGFAGRSVRGVGYLGTCFGCQTLNANSVTLRESMRATGISINRCDTAVACSVGGK